MAKHTSKDGKGLVVRTSNPPGEALLIPEIVDLQKVESNIDKMAEQLFLIRHDQGAIERWVQSLANRWAIGVKGKEVEKFGRFAAQAAATLKNMVDAQSFKNQFKLMYYEGLRKELEVQAELPLVGELAREKMRMEITKVKWEIKQMEDKIGGRTSKSEDSRLDDLREQIRFRADRKIVEIFGQFRTREAIEKEAERLKKEIRESKRSEEGKQRALEDLEDFKNYALDHL